MAREIQQGILPEDPCGLGGGHWKEIRITVEVGEPERRKAALIGTKDVSRTAQAQVLLGDHEAIVASFQDPQPFESLGASASLEQDAGRGMLSPADAPAELVELGQAEALRVLNEEQGGVGDVDPDLDHGGGDKHTDFPGSERLHDGLLLRGFHFPMEKGAGNGGETLLPGGDFGLGGFCGEFLGLLDQR